MNIILLTVLVVQTLAIIAAGVVILADPSNARRVASRLIGWAMFVENLYAEVERCRAIGNEERDRRLQEFGIEA